MRRCPDKMPSDLEVYTEVKEKVGIEENTDDQDTQRREQVERIPENVGMRIFKAPFEQSSHRIIDGEPKA